MEKQTTLKAAAQFRGKGLHTGVIVNLSINPAPINFGYQFKRIDIEGNPLIKADARKVSFTQRGTVLSETETLKISTIEHLLSALRGMRIDNCLIELDGPEVPILDGSAKPFVDAIKSVGIEEQDAERQYMIIDHKVVYEEPEKGIRIMALPEDHFAAQVNIEFAGSRCLANQFALIESLDEYDSVYDCRTFCFLHEVQFLLQNNLIKGGDLENAIVFVDQYLTEEDKKELARQLGRESITIHKSGVLNDRDLKYSNEATRHKLLDLIGDLSLVGRPIKGRFIATRSGHGSNTAFARQLLAEFK